MTSLLPFELKPDERTTVPLYVQLAQKLGQAIRGGRYQPDEALPSERMLSDVLGLSRVTARKAIDQLVAQGLVVRKRGSGNYIAPELEQPLTVARPRCEPCSICVPSTPTPCWPSA